MANQWFKFKKFEIQQQNSAMKVGTDGVLLGAWAGEGSPECALDIGAGTGLISLMLAQRFPDLSVDAVEINPYACLDAEMNFHNAPWKERLSLFKMSFQEFVTENPHREYDLIVSNPPYFSQALNSANSSRSLARHDHWLSLGEIISLSAGLLSEKGYISLIIPYERYNEVLEYASMENLFPCRILLIRPVPGKKPHRFTIELSRKKTQIYECEMVIENSGRHQYSQEYIQLTRDFYLNM